MNIKIKPEFKNLIRSLSLNEFEQLEKNCINEGIREPLIVWNNWLIDGHHRYEIAQKHSLPFETVSKEFDSEYQVISWMIDNQLGRRNLTSQEMSYLRGLGYENEKARHGKQENRANQYTKKVESAQNEHSPLSDKTCEKFADKHGVSRETIKRDAKFATGVNAIASVAPEKKDEILQGKSDFTKKDIADFAKIEKDKAEALKQIELAKEAKKEAKEAKKEAEKARLDIERIAKERAEQLLNQKNDERELLKAAREVKAKRTKEKKAEQEKIRSELAKTGKNKKLAVDFRHGDFEAVFSDIPDNSIDCIITDPPYPKEYLDEWDKLSRFAKRVLKPNGFCVAYSGQMYLPEVMQRLSQNLDYYWTFAVYHEGQTQIVNGVNLICRWKPVLIFQNGKKKLGNTFQDYFISEKREKTGHDWQQSLSGVNYLVEMFTQTGDSILDPFTGSGTTLISAHNLKRVAIGCEIDKKTYNIAKGNIHDKTRSNRYS